MNYGRRALFVLRVSFLIVFLVLAVLVGNAIWSAGTKRFGELVNAAPVRVVRVVDGDTIKIEGGEKVRYIGVNTPETKDPRRPVQCFGKEAAKKNKELVENKLVRLESDVQERDKYGRLLRYVWVGEKMINLELVKEGYAQAASYPPNVKHQELFRNAEREARETKRGLWGACEVKEVRKTKNKKNKKAP